MLRIGESPAETGDTQPLDSGQRSSVSVESTASHVRLVCLPRQAGQGSTHSLCQKTSMTDEVSLENDFPSALELQIILSVWKPKFVNGLETFSSRSQMKKMQ